MLETFIIMVVFTTILIAYMQYKFSQIPAKTKEYLKEARRKNDRVIKK